MKSNLSLPDFINFVLGSAAVLATLTLVALAAVIVIKIMRNEIKIDQLLSNSPESSLSRFQFLIFTFTIGFCYMMVMLYKISDNVSAQSIALPDATGAMGLLGISAGGYVLSKGIQTSGDTSTTNATTNAAAKAAAAAPGPATAAAVVTPAGGGPGAQAAVGVDGGES